MDHTNKKVMQKEDKIKMGVDILDLINVDEFDDWYNNEQVLYLSGLISKEDAALALYNAVFESKKEETENEVYETENEVYIEPEKVDKWSHVPKSLQEAMIDLDNRLDEDVKEEFRNYELDDGNCYIIADMGLRNNWGLWSNSPLAYWFRQRGIWMADDMSTVISTAYYHHVKGKNIIDDRWINEQREFYDSYWEKSGSLEKYLDFLKKYHDRNIIIKINGKDIVCPKEVLTYADVVGLSDKPYSKSYTMTYHCKLGGGYNLTGLLYDNPEQSYVEIKDGMNFNFIHTDNA